MRRTQHIQQVYIADGFADDCEELIHRCSRVDQLNYPTFCMHYKEMNFCTAYQFRSTNAEIGELSEELLQIAKHYMVRDTSNFEESVAGLFLVYALLNLQPFPRFAALRLIQDDLPSLERIERVARRDNRLDVLYVLGNVLIRGPVHCHADARPRGMEAALRNNLEGFSNIDAHGVRPKGVYSRQNEELDLLRDMSGIFERYSKAKAQIPGFLRSDENKPNLAVELGDSLKRVITGTTVGPEDRSSPIDHHDAVQEIKKRAMCNVVSTVRHLDSAELRMQRSPKKAKSGKGTFPKKSSTESKPFSSSSDDDDDKDIESLAKDVMSQASFKELLKDRQTHVDISIDSLPRLVTTESDGKLYEIEIIDEMIKSNDDKKEIDQENERDLGNELMGSEVIDENNIGNYSQPTRGNIEEKDTEQEIDVKANQAKKRGRPRKSPKSDQKIEDEAFKQPLRMSPRLKRVLKRDMKKPILKSKFRKMGMLEVANFQEKE